ncbi:transposase [Photobacterium pectinilyticum]|uniref:transposase n=1 Tax=Photobacterium pectinilyticum TaxID=2906793 RepID=UPI0035A021B1
MMMLSPIGIAVLLQDVERYNYFSDFMLETALMLKGKFKLPLRALQGFIDSLFGLMGVDLVSQITTA